jgi:hypothetical protein
VLTLKELKMDEDHCRILGDFSRPDLEIVLDECKITSAGASALAKVLGRNQGPTNLTFCDIDNFVLADGLRGNSRLKILRPLFSCSDEVRRREVLAIAGALRENKGLVDLHLMCHDLGMNGDTWGAICDSLKAHPTLEVLHICLISTFALLKSGIQKLVDMVKVNMAIHTIHLDSGYTHHDELFRDSVVPYLETNRLRSRVRAIQRTHPIPYRVKVVGRALLSARTDANRFWMLLSGNTEVAFPSVTTIAAAANLPTPTTAAANTSNANVVAVTASVTTTLTTTVTGTFPTAAAAATATAATSAATPSTDSDALTLSPPIVATAANAATPSSRQKRKHVVNPTMD